MSRRPVLTRAAAALVAVSFVRSLAAAPGDITAVPAPMLAADAPKVWSAPAM